VRRLSESGAIRSERVAAAMLAVPRECFLGPDTPVERVYADGPVLLKRDLRGDIISTISQPTMIATMLEQLDVQPGSRVLEIGTASGYNAALLAHLAGPNGVVFSVELEADLAAAAERSLAETEFDNVHVVCADGRAGWPEGSPYDRVVVTAAAEQPEPAWVQQLKDGGRLVVPIGDTELCFGYEKRGGELVELSRTPARFVRLRGAPGDTE